jgi:hypothetical protein
MTNARFVEVQHDVEKMAEGINQALEKLVHGCGICWAQGKKWEDHELDHCRGTVATAQDSQWKSWKAKGFVLGVGWCWPCLRPQVRQSDFNILGDSECDAASR